MFNVPTIGCSKTPLIGTAQEPGPQRGSCAPLMDLGKIVGRLLRTRDNVKPLVVSVGHRVSLSTACEWILKLAVRCRLPETTRLADQIARKLVSMPLNQRR
jgi:deoxyribonuclease V